MNENVVKTKNSKGLVALIIILILLVIGMGTFIVYDKILNIKDVKEEKIVEKEKKDEKIENDYKVFADNLKKEREKYDETNTNYQNVTSDIIPKGYSVNLDKKGDLFIEYHDETLSQKFGKYKVAENVLSFNVLEAGQGGGHFLYFINEDGTVGNVDVEYGVVNEGKINVEKDLECKNIVSILPGIYGDIYSSSTEAILIDINGNRCRK